jgi:hypothetical protein
MLMRSARVGVILLGVIYLAACSALREPRRIPPLTATPAIVQVTADEIAQAMQEDRFFSDYGQNTLLVRGVLASLYWQNNVHVAALSTSIQTTVLCDLGSATTSVRPGNTITITAPAADAQRASFAVMLRNCKVENE